MNRGYTPASRIPHVGWLAARLPSPHRQPPVLRTALTDRVDSSRFAGGRMLTMQSALWWAPGLEPGTRRLESQLRSARSSDRTKVSGLSLRKTGIIGSLARDFWAFDGPAEPKERGDGGRIGKRRCLRPFRVFLGGHVRSLECLAGAGGFEPQDGELEIGHSRLSERNRRTSFR